MPFPKQQYLFNQFSVNKKAELLLGWQRKGMCKTPRIDASYRIFNVDADSDLKNSQFAHGTILKVDFLKNK